MRHWLAPFLLLSAAACSTISVGAFAAFRGPDALSAEASAFRVVSSTPPSVHLYEQGQVLRLSATRAALGQRVEEQFALNRLTIGSDGLAGIKSGEDENLYLYEIAPEDRERYAEVQKNIQSWHVGRPQTRDVLAMSFLPAGCVAIDSVAEERRSAFWLSVDEGNSFTPLARHADPVELALNAEQMGAMQLC